MHIRSTYDDPAAGVAEQLGCSVGSVYARRAHLRKMDGKQKYMHVVDTYNGEVVGTHRQLRVEEANEKLKNFRLYDGIYPEPVDEPAPSLWARAKKLFSK